MPDDKPRVLIIDDEPDLCELLEMTLSRMGLDCESCGSVADARARIGHAPATLAVEPHAAERHLEQLAQVRLVVDDQHAGLVVGHARGSGLRFWNSGPRPGAAALPPAPPHTHWRLRGSAKMIRKPVPQPSAGVKCSSRAWLISHSSRAT